MSGERVIVVGAGIVGACAALRLARAGARVAVLEAGVVGGGSTGASAGNLHFQLEHRLVAEGDVKLGASASVLAQAFDASHEWDVLAHDVPEVRPVRNGGLMVAETDEQRRQLERKCEVERAHGLPVELWGARDVRRRAPGLARSVRAASFSPLEGFVDPEHVAHAVLSAAVLAGATVHEARPVRSLTPARDAWRVETADGQSFIAGQVIVAAGPWTGAVLGLVGASVPVTPLGLGRVTFAPRPAELDVLVQHVGRKLSLKQRPDGRLVAGGGFPARLDARLRAHVIDAAAADNVTAAAQVYPGLAGVVPESVTAGVAATTPDHLPLLGPLAGLPGLVVAFAEQGITFGPLVGALAAHCVRDGVSTASTRGWTPARFAA